MWTKILLCALVGLAAASDYGWKSNTEYVYKIHGRTLTALHDVANQYAGVIVKAKLHIRPDSEGVLMAKFAEPKYAQIHAELPEGWRSDIDEQKLSYKPLPLTDAPFQIQMKNGVVRDLIVSKQVHNWEANFIKSIVSQLQLDTQGEHVIKSHVNQLPEDNDNSATYKTMEDTVTGKYETLYDISPLPEHLLQSQWLAPMPQMKGDGEFIEIVKTRNFSRGEERVGYHYGLGNNADWEPNTNQMGDFFLRSSLTRAIISGNLKRYTIQCVCSTNKIILSPTLTSEQKGMVVSHLNLTLANVEQANSQFGSIEQPQHLGSLVYRYNDAFSGEHEARPGQQRRDDEEYNYSSEEEQQKHQKRHYRLRRSAQTFGSDEITSEEQGSPEFQDEWTQDEPQLTQAPQTPLLAEFVGYKGKSIKNAQGFNAQQAVEKLCKQISQELQHPEQMPKERTMGKFGVMVRLVQLLNEKEMQQAASQLYTQEKDGEKCDAWRAYRDAVAEAGTGPALLTIQNWIQNKKIRHEEAAEIIATMAQSVRVPTPEYMRTFYNLATKEEVRSQYLLNDTAILAFSSLARKVYVDKWYSHNQYPVQSFGSFRRSENAKKFVAEELIPYLKQKLNKAVEEGDSHKVLVYVRALGNVGHQQILPVFEKYLEGDKQVSQFQRLHMVLAFDKLVRTHPKIARSVLYKIYQNTGDAQEIRAAAVYQLMRTAPPASMLQRMAQYTNVDADEHVNAAVQSAIESATELEGEEFSELADNARSAQPLLSKESYGIQYSQNYLRDYVVNEMNLYYKQHVQTYGSDDSFFAKGLKYYLRAGFGGYKQELINVQAMVSSIDELTNVLAQQTEIRQQKQKQQKQNHQQAQQNEWSSEAIARLLNIQTDEREQLEASALFEFNGGATRYFTINNNTMQMLPEVLKEIEDTLREGKSFHYTKFIHRQEMVLSFPTLMSFPFFYQLEAPTVMHFRGQVRASAEPKISTGDQLHKPHTITGSAEIQAVISRRLQGKLGFVTPFEHQKYACGYEKIFHVNIPVKSEIQLDIKNKQFEAQIQPLEADKNQKVFHYSTRPFTMKKDVVDMESETEKNTHTIKTEDEPQTAFHHVIGKENGIAFRVNYESERKFLDSYWAYEQAMRHDGVSAMIAPFVDDSLQQTKCEIEYDAAQSSARKVKIHMGYEKRYESEERSDNESDAEDLSQFSRLPQEPKARQQQVAKMAASGIRSADVRVGDLVVEFDGQNKVKYIATGAVASGPVDAKGRVLFYLKKQSANPQAAKQYEVAMSAKGRIPNTNGLDFLYALKFDPTSTADVKIAFGEDLQNAAKFHLKAKLHKSEERKQYLQSHPRAQECRDEMQEGNHQLPACANMTAEANLMDHAHFEIKYENVGQKVHNATHKLYNALRYLGYYNLDEDVLGQHGHGKQNQFDIEARFEPDFESVNVTLRGEKIESHFDNIRVNDWAKQVVAVHPVFPVSTRVMAEAMEYDSYRPICVVDKTAANTFDNKTYPIDLPKSWTVMMQYVPTFARYHEQHQKYQKQQEEQQEEQYTILVREAKSGKGDKEIKMTLRTPESQGQLIEVDMKPSQQGSSSSPRAEVYVNQKQYQYNDKKSTDVEGGLLKIYALPNGEVKIEVRDAYYIIYDGERVKLTATHDKFVGAIRGLCGTYTGEESTDFLTPKNCILRDPHQFAATYAVEEVKGSHQEHKSRAEQSKCYSEDIVYANVISDFDAGRSHQRHQEQHQQRGSQRQSGNSGCTKHQTRYIIEESGDSICFTIRPLPVCRRDCNESGSTKKTVEVHCIQNSSVAQMWKKQIDNGANPDFAHKAAHKSLKVEVPQSCSRN